MSLYDYVQRTELLLDDIRQTKVNTDDLITYINLARREVAMRSQCIRYLTPISGAVASASVTAAGSGYTNPTVSISAPDFPGGGAVNPNGLQASASAVIAGGTVASISITNGGAGYFQPILTLIDPTGSGAAATAGVSPYVNLMAEGQEAYPFSGITFAETGIASIIQVKSVAIIYANYRYTLPVYSWSTYQASIRQYPFQYQYVPTMASQYGRGAAASLYLYPIPSQVYQMEWDCFCLPSPLLQNTDIELIDDPWVDCVPYFAAYLAYFNMQNLNAARAMMAEFDRFMKSYSSATQSGRITNPYGRF